MGQMNRLLLNLLSAGLTAALPACKSSPSSKGTVDAEDDAAASEPNYRRADSPSPVGPDAGRIQALTKVPSIHFAPGKWELTKVEDRKLDEVITFLNGRPERIILTATASGDSSEYARQLGEMRARTIQDALTRAGIPRERITTLSYGSDVESRGTEDSISFGLILTGGESVP